MKPDPRAWIFALFAAPMACHQPRQMAPQVPLAGIDGNYTFTISSQSIKLEGQFIVAYSKAYLLSPKHCVPTEGPEASEEMRAAWYECWGQQGRSTREASSLRLRISEVDPINRSRWYARMRVPDTVVRCTRYMTTGDCTEILRARGMKWVDRNGSITVLRGFTAQPDTGRGNDPAGDRRLRIRCDTSAVTRNCERARGGARQ